MDHANKVGVLNFSRSRRRPCFGNNAPSLVYVFVHQALAGGCSPVVNIFLFCTILLLWLCNWLLGHRAQDGMTALHIAVQNGHDAVVKMLQEAGAAADHANKVGVLNC